MFFSVLAVLFIVLVDQTPAAAMKIAFTSNRDGDFEIYVMDADGSNTIQLTNNLFALDDRAAWSPDGTKIAFTSGREGEDDIYVMDADGSNPVNLTQNLAGSNRSPAWQPIPLAVQPKEKVVTLWGNLKNKQELY